MCTYWKKCSFSNYVCVIYMDTLWYLYKTSTLANIYTEQDLPLNNNIYLYSHGHANDLLEGQ